VKTSQKIDKRSVSCPTPVQQAFFGIGFILFVEDEKLRRRSFVPICIL
jgi:hypothetical protein